MALVRNHFGLVTNTLELTRKANGGSVDATCLDPVEGTNCFKVASIADMLGPSGSSHNCYKFYDCHPRLYSLSLLFPK